jgi:hypothetical protein
MSEVRQSRVVSKVRVLWMSIAARCVVPVGGMSDKPAFGFRGRGRNVRTAAPHVGEQQCGRSEEQHRDHRLDGIERGTRDASTVLEDHRRDVANLGAAYVPSCPMCGALCV